VGLGISWYSPTCFGNPIAESLAQQLISASASAGRAGVETYLLIHSHRGGLGFRSWV
jgi:hypothetical protein